MNTYNYKIRINCTLIENLSLNNKKINKLQYDNINKLLQPNEINFLEGIYVLNKTMYLPFTNYDRFSYGFDCPFVKKSLQFLCNREITESEFKDFINIMKNNNFKAISDNDVRSITYINGQMHVNKSQHKKKSHCLIQFVNTTTNKIIYNYDFISGQPVEEIANKSYKTKYTYHEELLWRKSK